jgi:hypothetical protein
MFFSFAGGGRVQSVQGLCWIIFLGEVLGELHVVHDAHLFILQFTPATLKLVGGEKWLCFFL